MKKLRRSARSLWFVVLGTAVSCGGGGSGGTGAAGGSAASASGGGAPGAGGGRGEGGAAGGSGAGSVAEAFLGTWTFDSGNLTPSGCAIGGATLPSLPLTGRTLVITDIDATHVTSAFGPSCNIGFAVASTIGTAAAGQTCGVMLSSGIVNIAVSAWTFTLSSGSLATDMAGNVPLLPGCAVAGAGSLTKTSP